MVSHLIMSVQSLNGFPLWVCAQSLSCVWLFSTPWTVTRPTPLSMASPGKDTGVGCHFLLRGSSWPRDWTHISCVSRVGRQVLYHSATWEAQFTLALRVRCKHIHVVSEALLLFISWNSSFSILLTALQPHWPYFRSLNHVKLFLTSLSWLVAFLSEYSPHLHPCILYMVVCAHYSGLSLKDTISHKPF